MLGWHWRGNHLVPEGGRCRSQTMALEPGELRLGALDEPVKRDLRDVFLDAGRAEVLPESEFPAHTDCQPFELEQAAQVRVAGELAVRLQPPQPLGDEPGNLLCGAPLESQAHHQAYEGVPVLLDLAREIIEEAAELGAPVRSQAPARERESGRRAAQMVIQVDAEKLSVQHGGPAFLVARNRILEPT